MERSAEGNESHRNSSNIMVQCAVSKEKFGGPYFFRDENFTGENYRNMRQGGQLP